MYHLVILLKPLNKCLVHCVQVEIRRIAYNNVETLCNPIHPLGIEEWRGSVLIIRVPCGEPVRCFAAHAATCEYAGYFFANLSIAPLQGELVTPALGGEVFVAYGCQLTL